MSQYFKENTNNRVYRNGINPIHLMAVSLSLYWITFGLKGQDLLSGEIK